MKSHHVLISGTGRTGTTFLVQLLTVLGLDTGFDDPTAGVFENCNAGMEHDLRHDDAPYIVKDPRACDYIDALLEQGEVVLDHVIIPIRDLFAAAQSRREVERRTRETAPDEEFPDGVNGGLWGTMQSEMQEAVLAEKFHQLIFTFAKHDIPFTVLAYPRFVYDPWLVYERLQFLLKKIPYCDFLEAYMRTVQPRSVHEFDWRKMQPPRPEPHQIELQEREGRIRQLEGELQSAYRLIVGMSLLNKSEYITERDMAYADGEAK